MVAGRAEGVAATKRMLLERCEMGEEDGQSRSIGKQNAARSSRIVGEGGEVGGGLIGAEIGGNPYSEWTWPARPA